MDDNLKIKVEGVEVDAPKAISEFFQKLKISQKTGTKQEPLFSDDRNPTKTDVRHDRSSRKTSVYNDDDSNNGL